MVHLAFTALTIDHPATDPSPATQRQWLYSFSSYSCEKGLYSICFESGVIRGRGHSTSNPSLTPSSRRWTTWANQKSIPRRSVCRRRSSDQDLNRLHYQYFQLWIRRSKRESSLLQSYIPRSTWCECQEPFARGAMASVTIRSANAPTR